MINGSYVASKAITGINDVFPWFIVVFFIGIGFMILTVPFIFIKYIYNKSRSMAKK